MNYLAHAYLAGDADSDRLGGLVGDFVKGPLPCGLPPDLAAGVALHRRIDSYADLRRRYSGVMVDMFYDHLLAAHWSAYSSESLTAYSRGVYDLLDANAGILPERLGQVRVWMRKDDWLCGYRTLEGTGDALDRMAKHRLSRPGTLPGAIEELANDYQGSR
jgi:acyl carrier protein phosphodiesterase